jgi:polysaccharide biosynthesis transport protein
MSQDLARNYSPRNAPSADDMWMQQQALAVAGQGGGTALASGGGNEVQPLKIVHRSLRGRYALAAMLAAVGAVAGAALGWSSNEKMFRAKGLVRIQSQVMDAKGDLGPAISEYTRYMGSEASSLRTEAIVNKALANPKFVKATGGNMSTVEFAQRLSATFNNSTQDILINFDHPNPTIALTAVDALLASYSDYRNELIRSLGENSVKYLNDKRREINDEILAAQTRIALTKKENDRGDIDTRAVKLGDRLAELEAQRDDEQFILDQMEKMAARAKEQNRPIDLNMLASTNPFIARLMNERDNLMATLATLKNTYGPNSPQVRRLEQQLGGIDENLKAMVADAQKKSFGFLVPLARTSDTAPRPIEVNEVSLANKRDDVAMLNERVARAKTELDSVDEMRFNIAELNNQIKAKSDQLKDTDQLLTRAQARSQTITAPFSTNLDPAVAIQEDKRTTMAAFGFVVGGGLPIAALVAFGLLDRKYRYSDETVGSGGTRGVPLLGILPNLPDRLSDPSQASVAAHCVHQIRTMLQLNCLNDGPSVLSVTSATSGDGKTSLSLALGLSFAASGSRTLLVDTDLIGGGLSARLGIREPVGVSESITQRDPMQFVRETDVQGLSVLPVGANGPQNASAFSPSAVRRLVGELRKHFDIVLIDTGPVLGSIEATPVVAASDAVILTVARGQDRMLVEKAIGHLRTIGARIAGVVFNKANAKDFERSISGISLRSVSRASANGVNGSAPHSANGKHQDKRLGPLVHSVRGTRDEH